MQKWFFVPFLHLFYQLLNCFTGSEYTKRNIFEDYAYEEYCDWFAVSWNLMELKLKRAAKWQIQKEKNNQMVISYLPN